MRALRRERRAGFTLMELLIVLMVAGLLVSMAVPGMTRVTEAAKVDAAGAALRSVWSGQRMYHLEHGEYATALRDLDEASLLDDDVRKADEPFSFAVLSASAAGFSASAVRTGSETWSGTLLIDETGVISGDVRDGEGHAISPQE